MWRDDDGYALSLPETAAAADAAVAELSTVCVCVMCMLLLLVVQSLQMEWDLSLFSSLPLQNRRQTYTRGLWQECNF